MIGEHQLYVTDKVTEKFKKKFQVSLGQKFLQSKKNQVEWKSMCKNCWWAKGTNDSLV